MATVRRWYIFLVCAISLHSVTWAVIALLRNLFISGSDAPVAVIAFEIAVIVIGLPIFLVHWLWAQQLAGRDMDERESALRRLYLYGALAGFLIPFTANSFDLVATLLWLAAGGKPNDLGFYTYSPTDAIISDLVAMGVLALLWFYHQRVTAADSKAAPETGNAATVRRLYVLGFSSGGVWAVILAIIHLVRWIMYQFGGGEAIRATDLAGLTDEVARLAVGMPLWLLFWRQAQGMFTGQSEEERESALRKFYLYVVVFIAALSAVANATLILAGFFRRLLNLPSMGDIRGPLPIIIGMGVLWAYHAYVLRGDAALAGEAPRQAGVRRLYLYLIAAVGLAAFLVGLSGDISVLIRSLGGQFFGPDLKEQLAWFTAALIAGLPVWLLPWRQAQVSAVAAGNAGAEERRSVVRKIYLYFYLFLATMTVLSSAVYIVYRLLSIILGAGRGGNLFSDLGQAIAFSIIAIGVWLYHGFAVRGDGQLNKREQTQRLGELRVTVVNVDDGRLGAGLVESLRRELPGLNVNIIGPALNDAAANQLAEAGLIVGPWDMAVASGPVSPEFAQAIVASPARKLLIPARVAGWEWAGVDRWNVEAIIQQTVRAVNQILEGEEVKPARPLGAGAIIGIIIGVPVLLILLAIPVLYFFSMRGF